MNPLVRNILIIGTALVLGSLIGGLVLWVMPVEAQIAQLTSSLQTAKNDKTRSETALKALEASTSVIREQLDQLALYDLRDEPEPQSVLQTRSNSQLIQVSRILEEASVSVQDLNLVRSENVPIGATGSTPIASVQKQHFRLRGSALYRDFLYASRRLQELPPTVAVNDYTLTYIARVGSQAKVDVNMDLSFNFLMKVAGSAAGGAAGAGSAASAFDQMMKGLSNKGSWLPGAWRVCMRAVLGWLDPPAYAATGYLQAGSSGVRVVADGPIGFRSFRLPDGRVVVDMPGLEVPRKQTVRIGRGGVRTARLAQFSRYPLVGRLVLDTARGAAYPRKVRSGVFVPVAGARAMRSAGGHGGPPYPESSGPSYPESSGPAYPESSGPSYPESSGSGVGMQRSATLATPPFHGPRVRATPMPAQQPVSVAAARPEPAPEPDFILRRVVVRPWRDGEIRRVDVRPPAPDILIAVTAANPGGISPQAALVPPPPGGGPLPPGGAPGSAAEATGVVAAKKPAGLVLPEIQIGRVEPFLPLVEATDDASLAAFEASRSSEQASASDAASQSASGSVATLGSGSVLPLPAPTPVPPVVIQAPIVPIVVTTPRPSLRLAVTLRGILMGGQDATGLFEVNGEIRRAKAGWPLGPGYTVRGISRGDRSNPPFALISTPYGTERKELMRTWAPVQPAPAPAPEAAPGPAGSQGAPGAPPVSQIPLPNQAFMNGQQQGTGAGR